MGRGHNRTVRGGDGDGDTMGRGHNGTGALWDWGTMGREYNGTGVQWDGDTMGREYNGTGAQWNGSTMGRGHNGTGVQWDRGTMGRGYNGTGAQWEESTMGRKGTGMRIRWDWDTVGRGHNGMWEDRLGRISLHADTTRSLQQRLSLVEQLECDVRCHVYKRNPEMRRSKPGKCAWHGRPPLPLIRAVLDHSSVCGRQSLCLCLSLCPLPPLSLSPLSLLSLPALSSLSLALPFSLSRLPAPFSPLSIARDAPPLPLCPLSRSLALPASRPLSLLFHSPLFLSSLSLARSPPLSLPPLSPFSPPLKLRISLSPSLSLLPASF